MNACPSTHGAAGWMAGTVVKDGHYVCPCGFKKKVTESQAQPEWLRSEAHKSLDDDPGFIGFMEAIKRMLRR